MLLSKCSLLSRKLREFTPNRYFSCLLFKRFALQYYTANQTRVRSTATMDNGDLSPTVKISEGWIRGCKRKTIYDHAYFGFEGIPYGQPPLGELRFKSPLPAQSWSDIKDCSDFDGKPAQKNYQGEIEGSEDCLYLNVYAKTLNGPKKLPVLVWIYGGGFSTGSCVRSKYGPDYFMQEDVILVTFNYRLSSLGFLSLGDPSLQIPGNAGLKDQVLALKWVRNNIAHFGGDNENITLFGESAGSASVHFMLCTEHAKGLFHKAICMSGCILNNWAFTGTTTDLAYRLACETGYKGESDDRSVLEFLQNCSAKDLLNVDKLNAEATMKGRFYAFVPSLEPYDSADAVVRKPLLELMKTSWGNAIPLMVGGTSFEGLVRYPALKQTPDLLEKFKTSPDMLVQPEVLAEKSANLPHDLMKIINDLYFKDNDSNHQQDIMSYLDYFSFGAFWHGVHRLVRSRQLLSTAPTYQYLFDFDSPTFNHHRQMFCGSDIQQGVAHADDLSYLFYSLYSWPLDRESKEYLTIRRMIDMWTSFAKSSNPNCAPTKDSAWKTLSETNGHKWLKISDDVKFEEMSNEFKQKLDMWNSLYGEALL